MGATQRERLEHGVAVRVVENVPAAMMLREAVAEGVIGEHKFEVAHALNAGGPTVVAIGGRQFVLDPEDLVRALFETMFLGSRPAVVDCARR